MTDMYIVENLISIIDCKGLKVEKLASKEGCETLLIVLEKGHWFPEHTSPRDVLLIVLEGDISFNINNTNDLLQKHQTFTFPANEKHKVFSNEDSKFLIIR
jgi:quercetin dioxygenase-like cupin family protein